MATEIERKFLVASDSWRDGTPGTRMTQGYLARGGQVTIRIRLAGEIAWLTVKGRTEGISRPEYEYLIPAQDAREMLALSLDPPIDKTRYEVTHAGHIWEVDVFHGTNDGLVTAEVELDDESIVPELPPWVGRDVSDEPRYTNSSLAARPYTTWPKRA